MDRVVRIALAQINPVVGDLWGNSRLIVEWIGRARDQGAGIVLFPELAITGYPPEDLVLKPAFVRDNLRQLNVVVEATKGISAVVGFVDEEGDLFNAAAFIHDGELKAVYHKVFLPNYGVFDEQRYFTPGHRCPIIELGGVRVGMSVCEDAWYPAGPMAWEAQHGAELLLNINGSPYHEGKRVPREAMIAGRAAVYGAYIAWVNTVGGQDELVFDGRSVVIGPDGDVLARGSAFAEDLVICDIDLQAAVRARLRDSRLRRGRRRHGKLHEIIQLPLGADDRARVAARIAPEPQGAEEDLRQALVLGLRDYTTKNGFTKVLIGLSGGIDSALVAALAVAALGPDRVECVSMPTRYNSAGTRDDARVVAESLGVGFRELAIEDLRLAFHTELPEASGLAAENLQARIRGVILMTLSNQHGWLVLTTGNKSEVAVGYSTLYGDSCGGFAPIKDVPKLLVFALCRHLNAIAGRELIPLSIIERPPSAELRDDQRDDESLPPYEVLDPILDAYVEQDLSPGEIAQLGIAPLELAERIARLVDRAEYKRRQSPPGIRVHGKAFGRDRRLPITNRAT